MCRTDEVDPSLNTNTDPPPLHHHHHLSSGKLIQTGCLRTKKGQTRAEGENRSDVFGSICIQATLSRLAVSQRAPSCRYPLKTPGSAAPDKWCHPSSESNYCRVLCRGHQYVWLRSANRWRPETCGWANLILR